MEKKVMKTTVKIASALVVATGIVAVGAIIASKDAVKGVLKSVKKAKEVAQDIADEDRNTQVVYEIKENDEGNQTLKVQEN